MAQSKRVAITGMGTVNPLGDTLDTFYNNLIAGKSGLKIWQSLDLHNVDCKIGGDMGDYDFAASLARFEGKIPEDIYKKTRKLFRNMTFSNKSAVVTAIDAYLDAKLFGAGLDPFRVSVLVGGHNFNTKYVNQQVHQFETDPEWIDPLYGIEALDPNIPGTICEVLNAQGPAYNVGAACASGNIALRDGFRDIVTGESDAAVISGPFWDMNESDMYAMSYLNALVTDPRWLDCPEKASRPFDKDRGGFVASHGAGAIILEDLDHAKARGAHIYAEVLAVAANSNANHTPQPSSEAQAALMKKLLKMSGVSPEEVDFVSCHATGTPLGDIKELTAVKEAFGKHAYDMKLNAPKSMLGHVCWSAPVVETIGAVLQMNHGKLHQTINIDELAEEVDLDVCKDGPVDMNVRVMLKNSFGFGGLNCCSLIRKYEG